MSKLIVLILALGCMVGAIALKATVPGPEDLGPQIAIENTVKSEDDIVNTGGAEVENRADTLPENTLPENLQATTAPLILPDATPIPAVSPSDLDENNSGPESAAESEIGQASEATRSEESQENPLSGVDASQPLHKRVVIVDTHVETPLLISEKQIKLRDNQGQVSLEKLRAGGVDVVFFSIFVNPYRYKKIAKSQADFIIKALKKELDANQDWVELATSHADIQRIVKSGKIAALMGMEGADPIEDSLNNLDYFYKQGVRYLGPTWSTHTLMADSSGQPKPRWKGLSKFGKMAVERMNKLGMLIDVSHLSDQAFYDVMKSSKQPVIATHSGVDGARNHARNLSDDMLKLMSLNGGVVGIVFYPPHLESSGKATTESVVKHIDHAISVMGEDHVGIGSDFDGLDRPPPTGLKDASEMPNLVAALQKKGYNPTRIEKVLGGNFMRVFAEVLKTP